MSMRARAEQYREKPDDHGSTAGPGSDDPEHDESTPA